MHFFREYKDHVCELMKVWFCRCAYQTMNEPIWTFSAEALILWSQKGEQKRSQRLMAEVVKLSDSQQPQNASRSFFSKKKMLVGPPTEHTSRNPVQLLQKGGKRWFRHTTTPALPIRCRSSSICLRNTYWFLNQCNWKSVGVQHMMKQKLRKKITNLRTWM